jgi:hypothetical protein
MLVVVTGVLTAPWYTYSRPATCSPTPPGPCSSASYRCSPA